MRRRLLSRVRPTVDALEHLAGGLGTAVLALGALIWLVLVALMCLSGIGLLLVPGALRTVRAVADRERARLSRWGPEVLSPGELSTGLHAVLRDPTVPRELGWLAIHATVGSVLGILGLALPIYVVQDGTFPLWYSFLPPGSGGPSPVFWPIDGLGDALVVGLLGLLWLVVGVAVGPGAARLQALPGRRLLALPPDLDLSMRVAELTATRAAALDAHAVELRRIERSLHDGAQNRLVAVTVLIGAARRALTRDPAAGAELLDRAQEAAEQALSELRGVVRTILPPVLDDRGLAGALDGLAASCAVPCRLDVDLAVRCAASVEATAYFVVAEALTNVVKHSGAGAVTVSARRERDRLVLRVDDDGHGGADEGAGSGLTGIRRRVEAFDGRFTLTSPRGGPTSMQVELPCGS